MPRLTATLWQIIGPDGPVGDPGPSHVINARCTELNDGANPDPEKMRDESSEVQSGESEAMTVKELIEKLTELDPTLIVVLAKDAEGNSYSPLSEVEPGVYEPSSTWSGEFGNVDDGSEADAVCLWPVN